MNVEVSPICNRERISCEFLLDIARWRLTTFLLLGALFLTSCLYMPNLANKKRETPNAFSKVSVFPKFAKVNESQISKAGRNVVTAYFKSAAKYDEVKQFYVSTLTSEGWAVTDEQDVEEWFKEVGGKELGFRKAGDSVVIQYRGENAGNSDWDYAMSFIWND